MIYKAVAFSFSALAGALCCALPAQAQFEAPTVQAGPQLAAVTAFPAPGVYTNTTGVALRSADEGADIHYTWDGSRPTQTSPKLERGQVLFITGVYDGDKGLRTGYTLRAIATKPGMTNSEPVTLSYTIERRDRTAYISEEVAPGVRMIRDSDNDKMFLIRGAKAFALIDSGMGRGALREYLAQFTGGLPIIPIFTHSHGDHIGQASQFIDHTPIHVGVGDRPAVAGFLQRQGVSATAIEANLKSVNTGDRIDLGDRALEIYAVPGHTPGSLAIFDPATGSLFTGDTFGNNSPLPPDVMWMQGYNRSLDVYLANVRTFRAQIGGRIRHIMTGHNDRPLEGATYLDNLERALQRGLDEGEAALIASWRPKGLSQLVEGDRFSNPDWFGVNINRNTFLPAQPDQIAGLTALTVTNATLTQPLDPGVFDYRAIADKPGKVTIAVIPTSSRSRGITIAGKPAKRDRPVSVRAGAQPIPITVTAADGVTTATYRLTIETVAAAAGKH